METPMLNYAQPNTAHFNRNNAYYYAGHGYGQVQTHPGHVQRPDHVPAANGRSLNGSKPPAGKSGVILAICAMFFCPLLAAFAVYKAYEADMTFHKGKLPESQSKAKASKYLSIGAIFCGLLPTVGVVIYLIVTWAAFDQQVSNVKELYSSKDWQMPTVDPDIWRKSGFDLYDQ